MRSKAGNLMSIQIYILYKSRPKLEFVSDNFRALWLKSDIVNFMFFFRFFFHQNESKKCENMLKNNIEAIQKES